MKIESIFALLLVVCISRGVSSIPRSASTIRENLKKGLNVHVRPEDHTIINITFVLTSLNKLNSVAQELSTTFILYMKWTDPRLAWDPESGEPEDLVFYVEEVWTPPLVVSNAIANDIYLLKDDNVPMRVTYNGTVTWNPRVSPLTTCNIDIAKFPFDRQTCHINITTWVHSTSELDLREAATEHYKNASNLDLYNDKAWNVHRVDVYSQNYVGVSGIEFKNLTYTLCFKRHYKFYSVLLITPFWCLSFLMALVFLVPNKYQDSKVTYSITLMLSFQMYLNLLQTLLPPVFDEKETNLLGEYTSAAVVCGTAITAVLIIQLLAFHFVRPSEDSQITGMICGTLQNTPSAVLVGKVHGNITGKDVGNRIEGTLKIYEDQEMTTCTFGCLVIVSSTDPLKSAISITSMNDKVKTTVEIVEKDGQNAAKENKGNAARDGEGNAAREGGGNAAREGGGNAAREGEGNAAREGRENAARDGEGNAAREGEGNAARDGEGNAAREGEGNAAREGGGNAAREGGGNAAREGEGNAAREGRENAARDGEGNAAREGEGNAAREGGGNAAREGGGNAAREGGGNAAREGGEKLYGIMTVAVEMSGVFECSFSGIVDGNEIKNGSITGKCGCKASNICRKYRIDIIINLFLFGVFLLVYIAALAHFCTELKK